MSDIDTATVDSLKALDPDRPIREADIGHPLTDFVLTVTMPSPILGGVNATVQDTREIQTGPTA